MSTTAAVPIGLGALEVSRDPLSVLVCYGLGSCIGISAYDPATHTGGMVHVVLPDSAVGRPGDPPGKFADTAIPALIEQMLRHGAARSRLVLKLAGGARMLSVSGSSSKLDVGSRNLAAVKAVLAAQRLTATAEDCGGSYGRTVSLFIGSGRVQVSTVGRGEREL